MFSITSRYLGLPTAELALPDGRVVTYVRRRILPDPNSLGVVGEHVVAPGERPDHIAHKVFGDAELAWRLADGNGAFEPEELTVHPGRRLRITLPQGIPGSGGAGFSLGAPPTPPAGGHVH
ncbi:LysM domain-containing protein [Allokutzneria sp. A3M-2-11 16]|uniref:LysM domain-containing protein n=1 Tax=Allokutzneria sp. A3M-2-11 16 TaxID=2962043 RepID=UPI0020B6B757|nr:LysM domain-containing protein [Allokutzneria sp. A3M-2-11 16]MCP3804193.1 LysM domain-containing protein [Allokutzneria sp. A3M-2-11 16]